MTILIVWLLNLTVLMVGKIQRDARLLCQDWGRVKISSSTSATGTTPSNPPPPTTTPASLTVRQCSGKLCLQFSADGLNAIDNVTVVRSGVQGSSEITIFSWWFWDIQFTHQVHILARHHWQEHHRTQQTKLELIQFPRIHSYFLEKQKSFKNNRDFNKFWLHIFLQYEDIIWSHG